jgi:hypothetical protein
VALRVPLARKDQLEQRESPDRLALLAQQARRVRLDYRAQRGLQASLEILEQRAPLARLVQLAFRGQPEQLELRAPREQQAQRGQQVLLARLVRLALLELAA